MIDSRETLEAWLEGHLAKEYAQVIAARIALRVLPYSLGSATPNRWFTKHSIGLFRATAISWSARNFPDCDFIRAAYSAAAAAANAANSANTAIHSARHAAGHAASRAARGVRADGSQSAALAAYGAVDAADPAVNDSVIFWFNLSADCDWLAKSTDPVTDARRLTHEPLWPRGAPDGWLKAWQEGKFRLLTLDPTYQVWTDWYDRRIEGNDAAFDIPGDIERIEDKSILSRLAAATDEDFWDKGATHVNSELKSWIDEARARAAPLPDFEALQRQIAAGAVPRYGSEGERDRRAALQRQIEALNRELEQCEPLPAPIGHNRPPLELDEAEVEDSPAVAQEVRILVPSLQAEIAPAVPDTQRLLSILSRLSGIVRWVGKKADLFVDEAVKKAGLMMGATVGTIAGAWLMTQFPAMQAILKSAAEWLQPLLPLL